MTLDEYKKQVAKIPDTPGVYFFVGPPKLRQRKLGYKNEILYIGKATSLKDRTRSYFAPDMATVRSPLIANMVAAARAIDWQQTDSVLEALLLEANLVRTHKPHANTDLKDDKSFNYVVITKENFPRIMVARGKTIDADYPAEKRKYTFGPFPHGAQLTEALRIIRKIFPYRDQKCTPCIEQKNVVRQGDILHHRKCKPCFNRHIGLCPGVCTDEISRREYAKIISRIVLLFQGKKNALLKNLEKDMKLAAKNEEFEEAARLRGQVFALTHIQDVSLIKDEYRSLSYGGNYPSTANTRIEAYDAAHLAGSAAVGVMVVVEDGLAQRASYRKFILKTTKSGDDPGALKEILSRRLGHNEWQLPRLLVVDGATAQINAAEKILANLGIHIPVVGVVKDEKHRPREIRGDKTLIGGKEREILLANAEAHRFAIGYHRKKSRKKLLA